MLNSKYPPDEIRLLIEQWLGHQEAIRHWWEQDGCSWPSPPSTLTHQEAIRHWWEQDGTYFVVCFAVDSLYFIRVFSVGGSWRLSQDREIKKDRLEMPL